MRLRNMPALSYTKTKLATLGLGMVGDQNGTWQRLSGQESRVSEGLAGLNVVAAD